jgi:alkylated DNA repair dioxygenase AlkB
VYHALLQDYEYHQVTTGTTLSTNELLGKLLPRMQERVKHLPFDVLPMGVTEWTNALHHRDIMDLLQRQIPFFFDTITTRHGASVTERRGTAWVAAPGIGALAYSGKLMTPTSPIPTLVQSTMRLVEAAVGLPLNFFDCALCNYYPTGDAACQFHTDPEHGTMWERSSCVVAMGDPRRFAFRPIPQMSTWQAWDGRPSNAAYENSNGKGNQQVTDHATAPAILVLFAGDIVQMWGTCNDDFHHAVYPGDSANSHNNNSMEEDEVCLGRISLVLKRAMVYRGQRRGHGLPGEGRRCRRMSSTK